jgi:hypothetical protein
MESLISREATSSLDRSTSASWRIGIGAAETFSKIKLPKASFENPKKSLSSQPYRRLLSNIHIALRIASRVSHNPRVLVHASLLLAVSLTVFGGRASSFRLANSALTARGAIASSALDEMAAAKVAASIAGKTDLLITGQATRQAAALSTQVPLPTISEGTLAKRQVVTTEGDATRGITTYAVNHGDTPVSSTLLPPLWYGPITLMTVTP